MHRGLRAGLARPRIVTLAALACLALLAWAWLLAGAGMGMEPLFSLAPAGPSAAAHPGMAAAPTGWSLARFGLTLAMWWIMMVAMMLPSAAPTILLYERAASHSGAMASHAAESFLAGYLVVWGAFSLIATMLQLLLESAGLLDPMLMASADRWLSAALLLLAGLYQLSPFKDLCLRHCRNPAQFLSRRFAPGRSGALRMGSLHGTFCVGCCWPLMMLLFVGGVMNLAWIALLAVAVASEKLLPFGRGLGVLVGLAFVGWGLAIALGPAYG